MCSIYLNEAGTAEVLGKINGESTGYGNSSETEPENYHYLAVCISADGSWRRGDVGVGVLLCSFLFVHNCPIMSL
jgi:hypothetical protein